jgi:NADH-ubiquinone oxidoreductase chain 5
MVIARLGALVETDIKKVVALSTLSQLGVMMLAIGLGAPVLAFFHLLTHAFFKALIFLCVGGFIFYRHHSQDLRQIGGFRMEFPLTRSFFLLSGLSLMGIPFLSGFYSKDLILEGVMFGGGNILVIGLRLVATGLTCSYRVRVLVNGVWGVGLFSSVFYVKEESGYLCFSSFILRLGAVMSGCVIN